MTLILNSENQPTVTDTTATLTISEFSVINYTNVVSTPVGAHVQLGANGTLFKTTASNSISSISAVFDGDLSVKTGEDSGSLNFVYDLTSAQEIEAVGNYFVFATEEGATITSITINYNCVEGVSITHDFASTWSYDSTNHWKACQDDHCVAVSESAAHEYQSIGEKAPTESEAGSTAYEQCKVCEYIKEQPKVIPMLTEDDYSKSYSSPSAGVEVTTWTLIDTSVLGEKAYQTSKSSLPYVQVGSNYYCQESFNQQFDDIAFSYADGLITLNVTNENGASLTGNLVSSHNLKITGYSLALETNNAGDAISVRKSGYQNLTIANETTVTGTGTGSGTSGLVTKNITVEDGAKLALTGYDYATWLLAGTLNVVGTLDLEGSASAFSGDKGSSISVNASYLKYIDDVEKDTLANGACGQHLVIVPNGTEGYEHNNFHYTVKTAPTTEAPGVLSKLCGGNHDCGEIALPVLNNVDYTTETVTGPLQGKTGIYDSIKYTWNTTTYGIHSFDVITAELEAYVKAGTSYYSIQKWNELYQNQDAVYSKPNGVKTLTMTLDGETTVTASDGESPLDGQLDLTLYDKVIINGDGILNISYSTAIDGVLAKKLEISQGATVNLTGFTTASKSGIKVTSELVVNGILNVTNFNFGHYVDGGVTATITVGEHGEYNISNVGKGGFGIWYTAKVTFNVNGKMLIDTATGDGVAVSSSGSTDPGTLTINVSPTGNFECTNIAGTGISSTYCAVNIDIKGIFTLDNIAGNGVTINTANCEFVVRGNAKCTINASGYGINTDRNNTILHCFFRDSSVTTFNTGKAAVANFVYFLVRGNDVDGDVKCNAKVTINVKSDAGLYASFNSARNYFCVNSSQEFFLKRATKGNNAIELRAEGEKVVMLKTNTYFENFNYIFYAENQKSSFTNKCVYTSYTVKKVNCGDMAGGALATQTGSPKDYSGFRS